MSAKELAAAGSLSSVLGATTTSGFLQGRTLVKCYLRAFHASLSLCLTICRLSRWKYWAPVVGCTTSQFTMSVSPSSSLLSVICRNLSSL